LRLYGAATVGLERLGNVSQRRLQTAGGIDVNSVGARGGSHSTHDAKRQSASCQHDAAPRPLIPACAGMSGKRDGGLLSSVRIVRVRIKQLLAVDLIVGDVLLAFRRNQVVDELLTEVFLDVRVL